jgi:NAD(P)-dependent dehydrogenase (short-subunit alcohol dehydrogenase family)
LDETVLNVGAFRVALVYSAVLTDGAAAVIKTAIMVLENKTIVVIGGTTGMGLAGARAFVREGARVVVVGRNDESGRKACAELGEGCIPLAGDATHPEIAEKAIATAMERFGGFDGLYHVAGGSGRKMGDGPLHEISDEGWHFTLDLNLNSLFYSNRAAVREFMKQEKPGVVLNLGSILGMSPSPKYFATHAYAAAKSAVVGFVKGCAAYYAPRNIRFNLLVPALVDTPMSRRAIGNEEIMRFIQTKQPLDGGRAGVPEDLDQAAVFFMSDQSKFVTGQVLAVDGGWSVSEGQVNP